jgi:hypothetical protein
MGVDVHEAGDQDRVSQVERFGVGRRRNGSGGPDLRDAAVASDQDGGIGNDRAVYRNGPAGAKPERPHHPPRKGLCRAQRSVGSVPG